MNVDCDRLAHRYGPLGVLVIAWSATVRPGWHVDDEQCVRGLAR
jgi:hypothetical protein